MKKALALLLVVVMLNECSAFFVGSMAGMHQIHGIIGGANVGTVHGYHGGYHGDTAKAAGKHAFCEHPRNMSLKLTNIYVQCKYSLVLNKRPPPLINFRKFFPPPPRTLSLINFGHFQFQKL